MTPAPSEPGPAGRPLSLRYAEQSTRLAMLGDRRMAQLAAWAGAGHALEELLWEHGLTQAPDPAAELATVGRSVAAAVEGAAHALPADARLTAREVVETAREALVSTFDESVHGLLAERMGGLAHLDACPDGGPDAATRAASRLDGRTPPELAGQLRTAAADCMAMAELLVAGGEPEAAGRLAQQSDAAAFEAYLVSAATEAGDHGLATVDLRWDLAADDERDRSADEAGEARQDRLSAAVGSGERDALRRTLEPPVTR